MNYFQIEKIPYNPNLVALLNDSLGQYVPSHTYRGFTLLPTPFKPVHDIEVCIVHQIANYRPTAVPY
jgi:hypothetical protein